MEGDVPDRLLGFRIDSPALGRADSGNLGKEAAGFAGRRKAAGAPQAGAGYRDGQEDVFEPEGLAVRLDRYAPSNVRSGPPDSLQSMAQQRPVEPAACCAQRESGEEGQARVAANPHREPGPDHPLLAPAAKSARESLRPGA